jgi:hypothetical protein
MDPQILLIGMKEAISTRCAGELNRLQSGDCDACACFTVRREGFDSSISLCRGCRSSVAETTGNRKTRRQPRRRMPRKLDLHRRFFSARVCCRQIRKAGTTSVSQRRLRSNSISHYAQSITEIVSARSVRCRIQTIRRCTGSWLQQTNLYKRAQALRPADIMLSCLGFKLSIKNRPGTSLIKRLDQS